MTYWHLQGNLQVRRFDAMKSVSRMRDSSVSAAFDDTNLAPCVAPAIECQDVRVLKGIACPEAAGTSAW